VGSAYLPAGIAPDEALPQLGDPVPLKQIEEQHIRRVLAATKSLQEAAAVLDIDQATLWRKRREYGI
jgi:NtrC-family two-component system response regulator AlgB